MTTAQLERLGAKIIRRMFRQMKGQGLAYGLDWPTARILFPQDVAEFDRLKAQYHELKRQGKS